MGRQGIPARQTLRESKKHKVLHDDVKKGPSTLGHGVVRAKGRETEAARARAACLPVRPNSWKVWKRPTAAFLLVSTMLVTASRR